MSDDKLRTIGFIGLGNMGLPMARNLARSGCLVIVSDADAAKQSALAAEFNNVKISNSPASFKEVDAIITMLPNGHIVRQVLIKDGIAAVLQKDTLIIDASSSEPFETQKLGAELASMGHHLVDSPVSGGMVKAIDGTLSMMLGADNEKAAAKAIDILVTMSAQIFRTGGLGTGHAMKALNNFVLGAGFIAAAEALIAGGKFGLDPATMVEVLNASSGRNVATEAVLPPEVLTRRFAANFTFALFNKDLGIADSITKQLEINSPLCALVCDRLSAAENVLGPQSDYTTAVQLWEKEAGIELPKRDPNGQSSRVGA